MTGAAADKPGDAPAHAASGALLTIDLDALKENYLALKARAAPAICAAVIKADAYGIGLEPAAKALFSAGCEVFFVAQLIEARRTLSSVPATAAYVLNGLFPGSAPEFLEAGARPVLGSLAEIEEWAGFCRAQGVKLPAAIHIDTGMNRLGLSLGEVEALAGRADLFEAFELTLVISHLACADEPDNAMNAAQLEKFHAARVRLPAAPVSIANSAGTLTAGPYRCDLVRPGIALYGGLAVKDRPNPMKPVVYLEGRIIQLRAARSGETVGYGATRRFDAPARLATVSVGYADGYFRALGMGTPRGDNPALAYIGGHATPIAGRISMDLISLDVTGVPENLLSRGGMVELIGPHVTVDDLAARAGTIGYEILTSLGHRYERRYIGGE